MAFDPAGNLYVLNHGQSGSPAGSVAVYAPGASTPAQSRVRRNVARCVLQGTGCNFHREFSAIRAQNFPSPLGCRRSIVAS